MCHNGNSLETFRKCGNLQGAQMSLLNKLFTQIKGFANDAQEASEDVGSIARQSVRDMDVEIAQVEQAQVGIIAEQNVLLAKIDAETGKIEKFAGYAVKAVEKGDDALALSAIQDKNKATQVRDVLQAQADKFAPSVQAVSDKLAELRHRRDEMARDTSLIEARSSVADAQDRAATVLGGIGNSQSASKTFDRLNEKVQASEARAAAKTQLAAQKDGSDEKKKYESLTAASPTAAQDELAAMKAARK
jgi:phage shock protein A